MAKYPEACRSFPMCIFLPFWVSSNLEQKVRSFCNSGLSITVGFEKRSRRFVEVCEGESHVQREGVDYGRGKHKLAEQAFQLLYSDRDSIPV